MGYGLASALHLRYGRGPQSLRQGETQVLKQDRLLLVRTHHAANAQLPLRGIGQRQHDVSGVDARELLQDRSRRVSQARA